MKFVVLTICACVAAFLSCVAVGQSPTVRPLKVVVADAAWAAHKAVKDQESEGAQGRKYDVMKCYAITEEPAFKCVALDIAGFVLDSGMASQLGVSFMDEYWDPNTARNRMLGVYLGANIAPEDGMREIRFMQALIDKTMANDLKTVGHRSAKK